MGSATPRDAQISGAPPAAGRVDHDAAGHVACFGERHSGDPSAVSSHRERFVPHEVHTERPRLAPVGLEQRVRIDVPLVAVAQEPPRDAAGIEPVKARPQLVRCPEVDVGPQLALQRVVVEHGRQHRFGGEQQVAVLAETHVGRFAADRQVLVDVLEKVDPEQTDPDVLGGGELLPESARRLRRRGVLVRRVALGHQHPAVEPRLAGEKQRGGAAGDAAADDHYVVSSLHAPRIPRIGLRDGSHRGHGAMLGPSADSGSRDPESG